MFRNHLIIAVRNLIRNKVATLINIVGLSIGIACCILIMLWVRFEFSYDRFHENTDSLYLVATREQYGADRNISWQSPPALAPALLAAYPEVVNTTRYSPYSGHVLKYEDVEFTESLHRADAGFFTMFSFRFLSGDSATAFSDKYSIVLTESIARKFFGEEDALGKIMRMDYQHDLRVSGVVEDVPRNSTIRFEALVPFEFVGSLPGNENWLSTWYNYSFFTLAQLQPGVDHEALSQKIGGLPAQVDPESTLEPFLFPYRDLNLYSVSGSGGFITTLYSFSFIAGLVLLIACINFMNLATARAGGRAKEVGVRKVVGASHAELVTQFYVESLLQAFLALFLALVLAEQFLPRFQALVHWTELDLDFFGDPLLALGALVITLITGLVSGSYPALVLSSFKPINVLRGSLRIGVRGSTFRRVLVVLQFAAAVVLIVHTSIVYRQFEFMQNKSLGYDRDNLVYFRMGETLKPSFDTFKSALLRDESVLSVTKANSPLSGIYTNGHGWDWEGHDPDINPLVTYLRVGVDCQDVFDIELADGRLFTEEDRGRDGSEVLINETFARFLGEGSALGKFIRQGNDDDDDVTILTVIGVVKDFHYKPVSRPIGPLLIQLDHQQALNFAFIRISDRDVPAALAHIEQAFREFQPDQLFDYTFAADSYEGMYRSVRVRAEILRNFAYLAVIISCLGLFGLASFMTEQRSKEIGIRKVLGASVAGIVYLLAKDFVRWVLIANAVALPLAYILASRYLESFSYSSGIDGWLFLRVGGLTVVLALLTVSGRSMQTALSNPVDAIRCE